MTGSGFDVESVPSPLTNARGMYILPGDDDECEGYHGAFPAYTLFLVGGNTEMAQIFLRTHREAAIAYAQANELSMAHISILELCHERGVATLGG